jgi:formamidopyrimidine-DNA glycosylase
MPELPEVETIKRDLCSVTIGKKITEVDFLWPGIVKGVDPETFRHHIVGTKIITVERRAKNIYAGLDNGWFLLFHMKMTGHLIYTDNCWMVDEKGKWIHQGDKDSPLYDPLNQYIRLIFRLSDGKILAFSDLRKFAYVKLLTKEELDRALADYGPEPLDKSFSNKYLADLFAKKNIAIKKVLMDQKNIAGIGNIYADEILWESKIHPLAKASKLNAEEINLIRKNTIKILKKSIKLRGTSTSDFRDTAGKKGKFGNFLNVYRRTDLPCHRDGTPIKRIVVGGRGTHFCPKCQKEKI